MLPPSVVFMIVNKAKLYFQNCAVIFSLGRFFGPLLLSFRRSRIFSHIFAVVCIIYVVLFGLPRFLNIIVFQRKKVKLFVRSLYLGHHVEKIYSSLKYCF